MYIYKRANALVPPTPLFGGKSSRSLVLTWWDPRSAGHNRSIRATHPFAFQQLIIRRRLDFVH